MTLLEPERWPSRGISPCRLAAGVAQTRIMAELRRPRNGRLIGGVCAALADRFGWNVSLVRLLAVLSILIPGPQVIFYIVAWVLIPGEPASIRHRTPTA